MPGSSSRAFTCVLAPPAIAKLFPYTTLFRSRARREAARLAGRGDDRLRVRERRHGPRSEEHTSELQSHSDLVCRLLLEKKKPCGTSAAATSWAPATRASATPPPCAWQTASAW